MYTDKCSMTIIHLSTDNKSSKFNAAYTEKPKMKVAKSRHANTVGPCRALS